MTPAIIGQFYDKFLSLKNEPQINRKAFFIRILIISFLCFCSFFLLFNNLQFFTSKTIYIYFWILCACSFYIMNIAIIKRTIDIWSYSLFLMIASYQISSVIILALFSYIADDWGDLLIILIYCCSQFLLLFLLLIISWKESSKKYGVLYSIRNVGIIRVIMNVFIITLIVVLLTTGISLSYA